MMMPDLFLNVKQIAELTHQHEETIRRKLRSVDAGAKYSSKKDGYEVPLEGLLKSGIATKKQVENYFNEMESEASLSVSSYNRALSKGTNLSPTELQEILLKLTLKLENLSKNKLETVNKLVQIKQEEAALQNELNKMEIEFNAILVEMSEIKKML